MFNVPHAHVSIRSFGNETTQSTFIRIVFMHFAMRTCYDNTGMLDVGRLAVKKATGETVHVWSVAGDKHVGIMKDDGVVFVLYMNDEYRTLSYREVIYMGTVGIVLERQLQCL